jgi:hypothetical protein
MWGIYTAKSFVGRSSTIVDIRYIREKQNVKGYLLKYLKKTWAQDNHSDKSWSNLQKKFPGLNHYRHSRGWLPPAVKPAKEWYLVSDETYKAGRYILEDTPDTLQVFNPLQKLLVSKAGWQSREVKGFTVGTPTWAQPTLDERSGERQDFSRVVVDNNPYQPDFFEIEYYNIVMNVK